MIVVIIAGGSGSRLWPLSTPDYPKHLLTINGQDTSLLQSTYERAKAVTKKIYVIPEISHADHVRKQLPELGDESFVVEPGRRGTASCIVAALKHLADREDHDEPIAFMAADHYIRDIKGFAHSFEVAARVSHDENRLVLVGVEPDYPATGFGYIKKASVFDDESFVYEVDSFKEKPDFKTAQSYIRSGDYLWNCGYFVGSINTFKKEMKDNAPGLLENFTKLAATGSQDDYEKTYLSFENDTIDYALIEHVPDLLVVPASFDWMDLGSFADIHKAVDSDQAGNHVHGETVELESVDHSFVQNYEDKPVAVIGLDNVVVVNTPHGLLVARKDLSQKVGDVSKRFKK
ncbi:hypothetical protein E6P97_03220 [Patescibacteria group bacterium]|nr:MAG: hypothetical protein E6P97_03220 [Patescibacteria group bacterium]